MKKIQIVALDGVIHISTEEFKVVCADLRANTVEEFAEAYKNFMNEPGCNIHENCIDGDCIDCFKDEWLKGARK